MTGWREGVPIGGTTEPGRPDIRLRDRPESPGGTLTRQTAAWTCAGVLFLAGAPLAAAQAPAGPEDARVKALLQAALEQAAPAGAPAQPVAQPGTGGAVVDLTIDEALALALEQNLDLAVERINPQTFDFQLAAIRGAYRPVVGSTLGYTDQTQLPTNQLVGGTRVQNQINTYNVSMAQSLPWLGGSVQVAWNNRRQDSNSAFNTFNPQFNTTLTASYTQPLLRGLRIDSTRQQLIVTSINRDISEIQLRAAVANTLAAVRNAYWELLYAREAVKVAQRSLELAEKLVEDNKVRVEVGALAPLDIVQAEAEAASRRQALAQAQAAAEVAQLQLKRLIVGGTEDPRWRATLNPVSRPAAMRVEVDLEAALRQALTDRTDLLQARRQLESNTISLNLLRSDRLPTADLVASYAVQGIGGTQILRAGGLGSPVTGQIPGGFLDALNLLAKRDFPTWNLSVQFSYPIGTSSADAQLARARLQVAQAQNQIKALELQVATEVTNAGLLVQSNWRRVEAARAARELAEKRLEAEQSKFEVGISTNFFVVQAQRDLADAQNVELRAVLDYARSLVEFERLQQTSQTRPSVTAVTTGGAR